LVIPANEDPVVAIQYYCLQESDRILKEAHALILQEGPGKQKRSRQAAEKRGRAHAFKALADANIVVEE
jgi:hypothetical protein